MKPFEKPPLRGIRRQDRAVEVEGGSVTVAEFTHKTYQPGGPAVVYFHAGVYCAFGIWACRSTCSISLGNSTQRCSPWATALRPSTRTPPHSTMLTPLSNGSEPTPLTCRSIPSESRWPGTAREGTSPQWCASGVATMENGFRRPR